jgi:hypothetical protein
LQLTLQEEALMGFAVLFGITTAAAPTSAAKKGTS